MCSPSVVGVELAQLFSLCFFSSSDTTEQRSHRIFPLARSTQYSTRFFSPSTHPATKIFPLLMIGEECPVPGSSVFHFTLPVSLQVSGKPVSVTVPSARGPRHPGQSSAVANLSANVN